MDGGCADSHGISAQGAFIEGNKVYSVVPWRLFLFSRTLMRDFEPQPEVTLRFRRAGQRQLCIGWATTTDYDARGAAGRGLMP